MEAGIMWLLYEYVVPVFLITMMIIAIIIGIKFIRK